MRCRLLPSISAGVVLLLQADRAPAVTWGADYFPNVPLTTQNGDTVHFYDDLLRGKRVVINFIYTRCGDSCPLETTGKSLGLSHSTNSRHCKHLGC